MDAQDADEHSTWYCPRCIAEKAWYAFGNKTLWQELIRTRKVLDKAKWWLNEIVENYRYTPISTAEMALKEITALTKGGDNE